MSHRRQPGCVGVACSLLLLVSCTAGPPPAHSPRDRHDDLIAKRSAQIHAAKLAADDNLSAAAEELEAELFLTDAGKVIARAIRAHGGWDAWVALKGMSYARDRIEIDSQGKMAAAAPSSSQSFDYELGTDGRFAARTGGQDPDEAFFLALPFALARLEGRKEYLGVESDAKSGELFEKIRCERGPSGQGWFVAYFDYSTYVLKRVFEEKNGVLHLTVFSSWVDVEGVKAPTKRSHFRLRSRFQHRDMGRPDEIDILADLRQPR